MVLEVVCGHSWEPGAGVQSSQLMTVLGVLGVLMAAGALAWPRFEAALRLEAAAHPLAADLHDARVFAIASAAGARLAFVRARRAIGWSAPTSSAVPSDGGVRPATRGLGRRRELGRRPRLLGRGNAENGTVVLVDRRGPAWERAAEPARPGDDRWRPHVKPAGDHMRGSALVEALVALVLIAIAGLMVATATATGLRASGGAVTPAARRRSPRASLRGSRTSPPARPPAIDARGHRLCRARRLRDRGRARRAARVARGAGRGGPARG